MKKKCFIEIDFMVDDGELQRNKFNQTIEIEMTTKTIGAFTIVSSIQWREELNERKGKAHQINWS